ncbi:alpha-galactosidase, partial [bacterium]
RASQVSVAPDKSRAVLFAWQLKDGSTSNLILQGLDPAKRYSVREVNLKPGQASQVGKNGTVIDGASLMKDGLSLSISKGLESAVIELTAN